MTRVLRTGCTDECAGEKREVQEGGGLMGASSFLRFSDSIAEIISGLISEVEIGRAHV